MEWKRSAARRSGASSWRLRHTYPTVALSARVDGVVRVTQSLAVYASRGDKALSFSSYIFGDVRLGSSIGKLTDDERKAMIANKTQVIDVSAARRRGASFLGHSYYHQNLWVSSGCPCCSWSWARRPRSAVSSATSTRAS